MKLTENAHICLPTVKQYRRLSLTSSNTFMKVMTFLKQRVDGVSVDPCSRALSPPPTLAFHNDNADHNTQSLDPSRRLTSNHLQLAPASPSITSLLLLRLVHPVSLSTGVDIMFFFQPGSEMATCSGKRFQPSNLYTILANSLHYLHPWFPIGKSRSVNIFI